MDPTLAGLHCIVTGASRGLGAAVASELRARGAQLLLAGTNADSLVARRRMLLDAHPGPATVHFCAADFTSPDSAEHLFQAARKHWTRLDALVNNAAVQGPVGSLWTNDWDGWTETIQVNLLAPVALCRLAVPWMRESGGGAIVNLSGGGATGPRANLSAYATAKAGLIRFTETLACEAEPFGVRVNAVAPGAMNTRMLDDLLAAGPASVGAEEYERALRRKQSGGDSPERAAKLIAMLLSPESAGITGRLLSAVWDPWEQLPARAGELRDTDWYTLRRVVPKDDSRS